MLCLGFLLSVTFPTLSKAAEPVRRSLEIELEDVPGVKGYEIRVTRILDDQTKKKAMFFKIKGSTWTANLIPGHYLMEVRSYDSRNVPGEWSPPQDFMVKLPSIKQVSPTPDQVIQSQDSDSEKVTFKWDPLEGALSYKLHITDDKGNVVNDSVEKDAEVSEKLPVAKKYQWTVVALMANNLEGEPQEKALNFSVQGTALKKSEFQAVDDYNASQVEWDAVKYADSYDYSLEIQLKDGTWKSVDKHTVKSPKRIYTKALPTGNYRVTIQAKAEGRNASEVITKNFSTQNVGTKSPGAIEQIKNQSSYTTKSRYFAVVGYSAASVKFSGYNNDVGGVNSQTNYNVLGGSGHLAFGTWFGNESPFGAIIGADMTGFVVSDKTSDYFATTLQGLYRLQWGSIGQVRFNLGLLYNQQPVTIADSSSSTSTHQETLSTIGPQAGVTVLHGFTKTYGGQVHFIVNDTILGISTPNKLSNIPEMSFDLGAAGTMAFTPNLIGLLGVSFHQQDGSYTATSGGQDRAKISGVYINLSLEYGF